VSEQVLVEELIEQRRAFVRVAVSRPVRLEIPGETPDEPTTTYKGVLIDLSERAARCAISVDKPTARQLAERRRVTINFSLLEGEFVIPGQMNLCAREPRDESPQVIVHFDGPVFGAGAKALRRELLLEQIRQRQLMKLAE
jgi:hypothetical protein